MTRIGPSAGRTCPQTSTAPGDRRLTVNGIRKARHDGLIAAAVVVQAGVEHVAALALGNVEQLELGERAHAGVLREEPLGLVERAGLVVGPEPSPGIGRTRLKAELRHVDSPPVRDPPVLLGGPDQPMQPRQVAHRERVVGVGAGEHRSGGALRVGVHGEPADGKLRLPARASLPAAQVAPEGTPAIVEAQRGVEVIERRGDGRGLSEQDLPSHRRVVGGDRLPALRATARGSAWRRGPPAPCRRAARGPGDRGSARGWARCRSSTGPRRRTGPTARSAAPRPSRTGRRPAGSASSGMTSRGSGSRRCSGDRPRAPRKPSGGWEGARVRKTFRPWRLARATKSS